MCRSLILSIFVYGSPVRLSHTLRNSFKCRSPPSDEFIEIGVVKVYSWPTSILGSCNYYALIL